MKSNDQVNLNTDEIERYARHLSLSEIGLQGQQKLKNSSILCIGAGGLGSPLLIYLAAVGVGTIGIIDSDIVDKSNLQRQVIHGTNAIGNNKTESARNRIKEINPNCNVKIFTHSLTNTNALKIIKAFDVICDCSDNFETRYLVNDACLILNKPNIYGSVSRFEGQATVFNMNSNSPNLRDLLPEPPPKELLPSCSESGVIGVLPGLIGLIQATEAIKIITGVGEVLDGRLLVFDSLKMTFKELKLIQDKDTVKPKELLNYQIFCNGKDDAELIDSITIKNLKKKMDINSENILLIDVRNKSEYILNSIQGSILIPLEKIENGESLEEIKSLSHKKELYIHCASGKRSIKALIILKKYGIKGVNVLGGIKAWNKEILN